MCSDRGDVDDRASFDFHEIHSFLEAVIDTFYIDLVDPVHVFRSRIAHVSDMSYTGIVDQYVYRSTIHRLFYTLLIRDITFHCGGVPTGIFDFESDILSVAFIQIKDGNLGSVFCQSDG